MKRRAATECTEKMIQDRDYSAFFRGEADVLLMETIC
jgi:hypothetical protein